MGHPHLWGPLPRYTSPPPTFGMRVMRNRIADGWGKNGGLDSERKKMWELETG
ncbi:hypothetical protein AVEN_66037-1, partial [Araneus ventricosus]